MPEFLQIVITKKADDTFHITWQDGKEVVRSEDLGFVNSIALMVDTLSDAAFKDTPSHRG